MKEAYQNFFEYFDIQFEDIIEFGVNTDTIYPEPSKIKTQWEDLIKSVENNETVYIRGYGRDAKGTYLYQELFKILLRNSNIVKDSNNNDKPTQLLQNITNLSKTIKKDNDKKEKIINYQVSHIFGKTKNPFLFAAPWNIVWKSKILDPFSGHETIGENSEQYKVAFLTKSKELYVDFIKDYNTLALKYFSEEKLELAFSEIEKKFKNEKYFNIKIFNQFKIDAKKELGQIV